jgi:3-deoxy-D-manno-octulosonic-acid transferase
MYLLYSILLSAAFLIMLPIFAIRRQKYLSGLSQRLGRYPQFDAAGRDVVWIHCVSVGEANAALPLVKNLRQTRPDKSLIVSVTTRTGRSVAEKNFGKTADCIFYFPLDFRFAVRRALDNFRPSAILLTETEIWPRFIYEAKRRGAKIAIVNGRISPRSYRNYSRFRRLVSPVFRRLDLALMQTEDDRRRIVELGCIPERAFVTGNLKFDTMSLPDTTAEKTSQLQAIIRSAANRPVVLAASTHEPEEALFLEAVRCFIEPADGRPAAKIVIAPRHPERFDAVAALMKQFAAERGLVFRRRSMSTDQEADLILLDSIGELAAACAFADIVFVGGSLIPHGGQSVLEPAAAGKAIVTGPFTHNFDSIIREMLGCESLLQIGQQETAADYSRELAAAFSSLLLSPDEAAKLGRNARDYFISRSGRSTAETVRLLTRHGII